MHRAALVAVAAALSFLPKTCATKQQKPPEAEPPLPAPVPITSATTPPIWHAPDPVEVPAGTTTTASPPPSPELVKARAAAEQKDFKKVRSLLEKKARAGKSVPEESQLVFHACVQLKDKACADAVKAKHPGDITE